jgi:hypothetical protein
MMLETAVLREEGEHPLPRDLARPVSRPNHRPRVAYEFHVKSEKDVERLRRRGLPFALLTSEWVTAHGYPQGFRPLLFASHEAARSVVESAFRVVPVRDREALVDPKFEEFATFLLKVDTLAARAVVQRNRGKFDARELYRRVRNEGLERLATKVRLQEFVPGLPVVGESLPKEDLEWVERNNPALPTRP